MNLIKLKNIRQEVANTHPLIHCITNPISINQCANVVLAVGGRPIMAEHPEEMMEITYTAQSLLLNLGNITDVRMKSMMISLQAVKENNIPVTMDLVGVACSKLRRDFARKLISEKTPTVIKGNYSEINALYNSLYKASGIDAEKDLDIEYVTDAAVRLAKKYGTIVLASGKDDIITDGKTKIYVKNGTSQLAMVTGTGCMLGALCSSYLSVCYDIESVVVACTALGIAGELAATDKGTASFMVRLIDRLSILSDEDINNYIKMEETEIEEF